MHLATPIVADKKRTAWTSLVFLSVCLAIFAYRFEQLGLPRKPGFWVVQALPTVLSQMLFNHHTGYTSLKEVSRRFDLWGKYDAQGLNEFIAAMKRASEDDQAISGEFYWWGAEDKGIVDFMKMCFLCLGMRIESVAYGYLLILVMSVGMFALAWRHKPAYLFLAASTITGMFLLLPSIIHNPQLASVLCLRCFPLLSMIACLHGILYLLEAPSGARQFALFASQLAIIFLVLHIRLNANWQLAAMVLAALIGLSRAWHEQVGYRSGFLRKGATIALSLAVIFCGKSALSKHEAGQYADGLPSGQKGIGHVFWHSIYSGLALNPCLAERYGLRIDDFSIYRATGEYVKAQGRGQEWVRIGGESAEYRGLEFAQYDDLVREMLFAQIKEDPWEMAWTCACYKPAALVGNLAWLLGLRAEPPNLEIFTSPEIGGDVIIRQMTQCSTILRQKNQWPAPWQPLGLLMILPLVLLPGARLRQDSGKALTASLVLLLGSIVPSIAGYSAAWYVSEPLLALTIVVYFCGAWALNRLLFRQTL